MELPEPARIRLGRLPGVEERPLRPAGLELEMERLVDDLDG